MNRVAFNAHFANPQAVRDPIAAARNAQIVADTMQRIAVNEGFAGRMSWFRGSGAESEPDPRADVAEECGWPREPTQALYDSLYLGDAVAARVVEFMPKECGQVSPVITDGDAEDTPFLQSLKDVGAILRGGDMNWYEPDEGHPLWDKVLHADVVSGIGPYGVNYLAFDDTDDPEKLREPPEGLEEVGSRPVELPERREKAQETLDKELKDEDPDRPPERNGKKRRPPDFSANALLPAPAPQPGLFLANGATGRARYEGRWRLKLNQDKTKGRMLVGSTPLPASMARVVQWEMNPRSPRYRWPTHYEIVMADTEAARAGFFPPTRNVVVHWLRCVHHADWHHHPGGSEIIAVPRMRSVLPELLDGRKISGAGGVAFWRNAILKIFLESQPQLGGDVLFNRAQTADEFENMMNGFQQWMFLRGLHANPVAPAVVDPGPHQLAKIERICIRKGWAKRIFIGSERGELASTQDEGHHSDNVDGRNDKYCASHLYATTINRLILVGVCEEPANGTFGQKWPSVGSQDKLKQAQIFATTMQGMAAAEQVTLVTDRTKLVMSGMTEEEADEELQAAEEQIAEEEALLQEQADEMGLEMETPEGLVDPEKEEKEQEIAMEAAKAGAGKPPPFGGPPKPGGKPPFAAKPGAKKPNPFARNEADDDIPWAEEVTDNHGDPEDPGYPHEGGGGGSIRDAVDRSVREHLSDDAADAVVERFRGMPREQLHAALVEAGVREARPNESKTKLLRRLHRELTAARRSEERAQA